MTIESQIAIRPAGPLIGGLAWRPPTGGKPSRAALAEAQTLTGCTHYALLRSGGQAVYGLFQLRLHEESLKLPKGAVSAAALFAQRVGGEAPDAALVVRVPPSDDRPEIERLYVVVLEYGLPSIDTLCTEADMVRLLGDGDRPMWSDNPVRFPRAAEAGLDWLGEPLAKSGIAKTARIQPVPLNPWPLAIVTTLAVALMVAWTGWEGHVKARDRSRALQAQAQADPKPRYLAALARERESMVTRRAAMVAVTRSLFDLPVFVPGWQLRGVECTALSAACSATWSRRGGSFDELRFALPQQKLLVNAEAAPALDQAVTTWPFAVQRQAVPGALPAFTAAVLEGGATLQHWNTADLSVDMGRPILWPSVPDLPVGFNHPQSVQRGEISAKNIPGPFVVEAVADAPPWVSWETVRVDVGEWGAGTVRSQLVFTLSGNFYVAAN